MNFAFIRRRLLNLSWPTRWRDQRRSFGRRGEKTAAAYLKRRRYRVIARNYRCPCGEIDLIATLADLIVFVEIKTRAGVEAADPIEAVRESQWRRVGQAAKYFLNRGAVRDRPCRFDLVTIVWPAEGRPEIEHFEDAFRPKSGW